MQAVGTRAYGLVPGSRWPCALLAAWLALGLVRSAHAQVLDKYFPANIPAYQDWFAAATTAPQEGGYDPLGVRVGDFMLRPSVTEGFGYDSDLFGGSGSGGSPLIETSAAVSIDSDWARNGVNAALRVDDTRYLDYQSRSVLDWTASVGGVIDYAEDAIHVGYSHFNTVSLPTDVGTFGILAPVTNQVDDFRISDTLGPGALTVVPALVAQIYQFSSASGSQTTAQLNLFNRNAITGSVTLGYEFAGGHNVIAVMSDSQVAYSGGATFLQPADYNDASVLVGIEYRQSALLAYRALVGYEERSATGHGTGAGALSAPAAELDVIWSPSVLTSVTARVSQSLQDQSTGGAQGLTQTSVALDWTYAYRNNISLNATAAYDRATFPVGGQTQSAISAGVGGTWSLSRNLALSLNYDFTRGEDTGEGALRFTRQQVFFTLRFQI